MRLAKWVHNKYRRFRRKHWFASYKWLQETANSILVCLYIGNTVLSHRLVKKSRMMREYHVRFCERFRGEISLCLLDIYRS